MYEPKVELASGFKSRLPLIFNIVAVLKAIYTIFFIRYINGM